MQIILIMWCFIYKVAQVATATLQQVALAIALDKRQLANKCRKGAAQGWLNHAQNTFAGRIIPFSASNA